MGQGFLFRTLAHFVFPLIVKSRSLTGKITVPAHPESKRVPALNHNQPAHMIKLHWPDLPTNLHVIDDLPELILCEHPFQIVGHQLNLSENSQGFILFELDVQILGPNRD